MYPIHSSNVPVNLPTGTSNQGNNHRPATITLEHNLCQTIIAGAGKYSRTFCASLENAGYAAMHFAERGFFPITRQPQDKQKLHNFSGYMQALYADLSRKIFNDPNYANVAIGDNGTFTTPKKSMPYFQSLLLAFSRFTCIHFQSQIDLKDSIKQLTIDLDAVIAAAKKAITQERVDHLNIFKTIILKNIQHYHPYPAHTPV